MAVTPSRGSGSEPPPSREMGIAAMHKFADQIRFLSLSGP